MLPNQHQLRWLDLDWPTPYILNSALWPMAHACHVLAAQLLLCLVLAGTCASTDDWMCSFIISGTHLFSNCWEATSNSASSSSSSLVNNWEACSGPHLFSNCWEAASNSSSSSSSSSRSLGKTAAPTHFQMYHRNAKTVVGHVPPLVLPVGEWLQKVV